MIDYVGDLSRNDAVLLRSLAERSARILEFGCGASTQIFAAYGCGSVDSVETHPEWIEKTRRNLARLAIDKPVTFHSYARFTPVPHYDMIFVDGIDELRLPFALLTWTSLAVGGAVCFHDTRRTTPHGDSMMSDIANVCVIVERHALEVDRVVLNQDDSNVTVVTKREPLLLQDWNAAEERTPEQIGIA